MKDLLRPVISYTLSFCSPEKRHSIASEICAGEATCVPGDMLYAIRQRYGAIALICADAVLFGWCLVVCALTDFLLLPGSVWLGIPALMSCIMAFCLCRDQLFRAFLKLGFLFFSFGFHFLWSLTAIFLLLFEHIVCGKAWPEKRQ